MPLAAPLILPFAELAGITIAGLGMAAASKKVSDYIRQNPDESKEIIKFISPSAAGIMNVFEKRGIGDNKPPSPIEDENKPKKEDPNFIPEILSLTVDDEKDDSNFKIETEEDFKKLEQEQKYFPFSVKDFEGGPLDNLKIKKALEDITSDIELTGGVSFDDNKFLLTPPSGQKEIALKFLKDKLIEEGASSEIIDHITNVQSNLQSKIKESGYYGAGAEKEKNIQGLPGYVENLINKRKNNAKGGFIESPLYDKNKYI